MQWCYRMSPTLIRLPSSWTMSLKDQYEKKGRGGRSRDLKTEHTEKDTEPLKHTPYG